MLRTLSLLICLLFFSFPPSAVANSRIKVGVSLPLSGNAATFGADIKDGLEFANSTIAQGRFEYIFEDDKCSGKDAVTVAHKLVSVDHVKFVIGFGCSEALLAAAPIYEKSKTLVISAGTAAPKISEAGDYIFRTYPSDIVPTSLLYKYIVQHHKKLGILNEDTSYPAGFVDAFTSQDSGQVNFAHETFIPGTSDFRSLVSRLKNQGIDGLLVVTTSDSELISLVKQIRDLQINLPIYSNFFAGSPSFLKNVGDSANGIIFTDFPQLGSVLSEENKILLKNFQNKFGVARTSDFYFVTTYAAIAALNKVVDSADPKEELYKTNFVGLLGSFSFDKKGDVLGINQVLNRVEGNQVIAFRD